MLMGGTGASTSESEVERRGRGHGKQAQLAPDLIANYNRYIGGVDQHDQMRKRYKTRRGCRRPYIAFFYYVLETSMVNSYLAFKLKYPNDQRTRKHLWRDVMEALWADDGDVFVHDDRPRQVPRKKKKKCAAALRSNAWHQLSRCLGIWACTLRSPAVSGAVACARRSRRRRGHRTLVIFVMSLFACPCVTWGGLAGTFTTHPPPP